MNLTLSVFILSITRDEKRNPFALYSVPFCPLRFSYYTEVAYWRRWMEMFRAIVEEIPYWTETALLTIIKSQLSLNRSDCFPAQYLCRCPDCDEHRFNIHTPFLLGFLCCVTIIDEHNPCKSGRGRQAGVQASSRWRMNQIIWRGVQASSRWRMNQVIRRAVQHTNSSYSQYLVADPQFWWSRRL